MGDIVAFAAGGVEIAAAGIAIEKDTGIFRKLIRRLKGTKEIVILGCSGTGKTQFINSLSENKIKYVRERDRTLVVTSKEQIFKEHLLKIYDTPGHKAYTDQKKELLRSIFLKNKSIVIINIVCYGYHIKELMTGQQFSTDGALEAYLSENRKEEIEQLSIVNQFCDMTHVNWVITLITKADLWNKDGVDNVIEYYKSSDYGRKLIPKGIHVVVPYCSVIQNFYDVVFSSIGEADKRNTNEQFVHHFSQLLTYKREI
jgi:ethanolamine utilization protein EutP (predicted NTPase)